MRVAVVGHVEWIELARGRARPARRRDRARPRMLAGAGRRRSRRRRSARAARGRVPVPDRARRRRARTAGEARARALGVRVEAAWRAEPQRRAFVHVDARAERTITVLGDRMGPRGDDDLPVGRARGRRRRLLHRRRRRRRSGARERAGKLVATVRAIDALAARRRSSSTCSWRAPTTPASATRPGDLDPPPRLVAGPTAPPAVRSRRRTATAPLEGGPAPRARRSTPTAPATASPPASPTASGRPVARPRRSRSARAAAPPA